MKRWDDFVVGFNCITDERLAMLKEATRAVIIRQPEIKEQRGRLCSAVFAELKAQGHFETRTFIKSLKSKPLRYIDLPNNKFKTLPARDGKIVTLTKQWNEKEFFCIFRWSKNYIWEYRNFFYLKPWQWAIVGIIGLTLFEKFFKSK